MATDVTSNSCLDGRWQHRLSRNDLFIQPCVVKGVQRLVMQVKLPVDVTGSVVDVVTINDGSDKMFLSLVDVRHC